MNRSLTNVLFGGIAAPTEAAKKVEGVVTKVKIIFRMPVGSLTWFFLPDNC